jgi:VIT1/CCC1 family predicted Fe2+/Mn2+ transporter
MEFKMERGHFEKHYVARIGWLRAAVLGANDGIVSTASLIVGVAAASGRAEVLLAGMAGLAAGALSMAAGEYVSVSSQADTEKADADRERAEIAADPAEELRALAGIYEARGLEPALALQVATALHAKDPLAAHLRDELGFSDHSEAKPIVASVASAASFAVGAALPLSVAFLVPEAGISLWVTVLSLLFLAVLGAVGAKAGGAPILRAVLRVTFWGAVAMAVTAVVGKLFGAVV